MPSFRLGLTAALALTLFVTLPAVADPLGSAITYQGHLMDGGSPANGNFNMVFTLWDDAAGGSQVGPTLTHDGNSLPQVNVANGLFTVALDFGVFGGDVRWLEVTVEGNALTPRQLLTAAPQASYAARAGAPWLQNGLSLSYLDGNVGIGTGSPQAKLHVQDGNLRLGNTADSQNWDLGYDASDNYFYIDSFSFGSGRHFKINHFGNIGIGTNPDLSVTDYKVDIGFFRNGLRAEVDPGFVPGGGTSILGLWRQVNGGGTGVRGETSVSNHIEQGGQTTYGVYGKAVNDLEIIPGLTIPSSYGVLGELEGPGGTASFGVFAVGPLGATGVKSFVIDHPLDPENKKLMHYCSEGPEPLNLYSGNIVTDAAGLAWVTLPDYFEAINRDFRYTLTIVDDGDTGMTGGFAQAKVAQKIKSNHFAIRSSRPHVEVSWEVKAVRNDRFVQRHGVPVEIQKNVTEKGKYLMPALYDQPKEKGIFHHSGSTPQSQNSTRAAGAAEQTSYEGKAR